MAQNVAQELERGSKTLYQKLAENNDLSNVIMGFLGKIILLCNQTGKPIQGVELGEPTESNGDFRFTVAFHDLLISPPTLWTVNRYDELKHYVAARSVGMARALEANNRIVIGLRNLVTVIDIFCSRKRIEFKDFKIKKAFISRDNRTCVIRSGVETLDRWGR